MNAVSKSCTLFGDLNGFFPIIAGRSIIVKKTGGGIKQLFDGSTANEEAECSSSSRGVASFISIIDNCTLRWKCKCRPARFYMTLI